MKASSLWLIICRTLKPPSCVLQPDQSVYIINLTAPEAAKVMSLTPDTAYNAFTSSVACIGSTVCQMGMGDSQSLLTSCFEEMATQYAASDALPQIYISGCPSSCGTHQIGELGFRGTVKVIKGTAHPAFTMYINGCSLQGSERLGEEAGTLLAEDIPFVPFGNRQAYRPKRSGLCRLAGSKSSGHRYYRCSLYEKIELLSK